MSDFITSIITIVAIAITLPIVFNVFYFLKQREEKRQKITTDEAVRTKSPTAIRAFFLGFAVLVFLATLVGLIICIVQREDAFTVVIVAGFGTAFALLGLLGYFIAKFNYEIIDGDKIIISRCFKKRYAVAVSDIARFSYTRGFICGLNAYDKYGIILFESSGYNLNIDKLAQFLDSQLIPHAMPGYPGADLKNAPVYKRYLKKRNRKFIAWMLFGFGLTSFVLFGLMFPQLHYQKFENYEVSGEISEYKKSDEFLTFKLEGDENTYCINNIVYDKMNTAFVDNLAKKQSVTLLIGYTDRIGRRSVSQVSVNGKIYLDKEESEKAEADNYKYSMIFAWVILGAGGAMLIAFPPCLVASNKIKVYEE